MKKLPQFCKNRSRAGARFRPIVGRQVSRMLIFLPVMALLFTAAGSGNAQTSSETRAPAVAQNLYEFEEPIAPEAFAQPAPAQPRRDPSGLKRRSFLDWISERQQSNRLMVFGAAIGVALLILFVRRLTRPRRSTAQPSSSSPSTAPPPLPAAATPIAGATGRTHRPGAALLLALLIPGAGQAYNGRVKRAFFVPFFAPLVLPWLMSIVGAWTDARRIRDGGGRFGRGGPVWVVLQAWHVANILLGVAIALMMMGRLS